MLGDPLLILGETDKPRERVQAVGKTWDREGAGEASRLPQSAVKLLVRVTRKQVGFDLIAAGTPPEKIDQQPNAVLVSL